MDEAPEAAPEPVDLVSRCGLDPTKRYLVTGPCVSAAHMLAQSSPTVTTSIAISTEPIPLLAQRQALLDVLVPV